MKTIPTSQSAAVSVANADHRPPIRIAVIFFTEVLQFARYSVSVPMILSLIGWIMLPAVIYVTSFWGGSVKPVFNAFPFLYRYMGEGNIHIGNNEIMQGYGYVSLVAYFLGSIIERVFRIRLALSLKRKIILLLAYTWGLGAVSALLFLLTVPNGTTMAGVVIVMGIMITVYGVFALLFSAAISLLREQISRGPVITGAVYDKIPYKNMVIRT